mmetsp:Transcript_24416/g.54639  ORF Transcript_24416/g.54639 Transcript_24416/m.54639 type:complete len:244 (-) Transcript_24416:557-1288(-)
MPIFSIFLYLVAITSSCSESLFLTGAAGFCSAPGGAKTAWTILESIPSLAILCFTPSGGTPILSILLYLAAIASSSEERSSLVMALIAVPAPSSQTELVILAAMPSLVILCRTASLGMPIFSILRYLDAIVSSSSDNSACWLSSAQVALASKDGLFDLGVRETSTSSIPPRGDLTVRRSLLRSLSENFRYRSSRDSSSSVRELAGAVNFSDVPPCSMSGSHDGPEELTSCDRPPSSADLSTPR